MSLCPMGWVPAEDIDVIRKNGSGGGGEEGGDYPDDSCSKVRQ